MSINNRVSIVSALMSEKRWKELYSILMESLNDPSNPESVEQAGVRESSLPICALNHLDFLVKYGKREGFRDDKNRFIDNYEVDFQSWIKGGCLGLQDQRLRAVKL